ncbi:hypothetical protein QE450_003436 [Paenibacillus sp. SORGH_AS306]|nr:hypothetical protein [Paenibacillus sp. SORGH_AS_0306]
MAVSEAEQARQQTIQIIAERYQPLFKIFEKQKMSSPEKW